MNDIKCMTLSKLFRGAFLVGLATVTTTAAAPAMAQDNPIPLNYRGLKVKVVERRNNQLRNIGGAQVYVAAQKKDRYIRLPLRRTTQGNSGIASFGKVPPSQVVGEYKITVEHRDCGKQVKNFRKNGGSEQTVTFDFEACGKAKEVKQEFDRRKQGGYDLIVKLKESRGTRGNGYWVHVIDKKGKLVKKVRSSGTGQAQFRALNPELAPYEIEVYAANKLRAEENLRKLAKDELVTINLDRIAGGGGRGGNDNGRGGNGGGGGGKDAGYDLTVKLDLPLVVHLKDKGGKTIAKKGYDGRSLKFDDVNPKHGPYHIEVYLGSKKLGSYDYKMPSRHASVSYDLGR